MPVKGIYNENEFYTVNYWQNKLAERVKQEAEQVAETLLGYYTYDCVIFWYNETVGRESPESNDVRIADQP